MIQKTCLITGANAGIGKEVALSLAQSGAHVILVCRDKQKGEATLQEIRKKSASNSIDLLIADLSSQKEIRQLSEQIHQQYKMLHVLINNAGISLPKKTLSPDGIEMNLATNHLGPFLLSHLLLDLLKAGSPARIINISSTAHQWAKIDLNDLQFQQKKYRSMRAYAQSKLFMTMTSYELARKLKGTNITVNSLHPGTINTKFSNGFAINIFPKSIQNFLTKPFSKLLGLVMITPKAAAKPIVYLATSPEAENISGKYFVKNQARQSSPMSYDLVLTKKIWELSEKLVGING